MTAFESRESLEEVLTKLAELVQADPAFLEASQGKTLLYRQWRKLLDKACDL